MFIKFFHWTIESVHCQAVVLSIWRFEFKWNRFVCCVFTVCLQFTATFNFVHNCLLSVCSVTIATASAAATDATIFFDQFFHSSECFGRVRSVEHFCPFEFIEFTFCFIFHNVPIIVRWLSLQSNECSTPFKAKFKSVVVAHIGRSLFYTQNCFSF